jgi:branched-chain amino acid transport system permease protein
MTALVEDARANDAASRRRRPRIVVPAGLVLAGIALFFLPMMMPNDYYRGLLALSTIYAIYGVGFDVQFGYAGLFNMAQAGFFGIGAYAAAIVSTRLSTGNLLVVLPIAVASGIVLATVLGVVALRATTRPMVFAMISLGVVQILTLVVLNENQWTEGPAGLAMSTPSVQIGSLKLTFQSLTDQFYVGAVLLAVTVFVAVRMLRSRLGSSWVTIRENVGLARSQGVRPVRAQLAALMTGAAITSIAGALYAYYIGYLTPSVFSLTGLVTAIVIVVVGGRGTIYGPVLGAVLYVIVPELLSSTANLQLLVFGGILCVIMLFLPDGTWPLLVSAVSRLRGRRS